MKLVGLTLIVLIFSGGTLAPAPEKIELSASAGKYHEVSEPIEADGSLSFRITLDELNNGTDWAPGAMISFAKGGYEDVLIFMIYQKEADDTFLTVAYRYAVNDRDVFFRDLPETYPIDSTVELTVNWAANAGFNFTFSGQPTIAFEPEFQVNKIFYSISSGSGAIEKVLIL